MAIDHYISQVYLRGFSIKKNELFTICKHTLRKTRCSIQSICGIEEGNTNFYFTEPRAIEKFLIPIENNYNSVIEQLLNGKIDNETIYTISGWIAYVHSCSLTGVRLSQGMFQNLVDEIESVSEIDNSLFPIWTTADKVPNMKSLKKGYVSADPKYAQANGIYTVEKLAYTIGNLKWELLRNPFPDSPFFTSDNPIAMEPKKHSHLPNIIVPLTPQLALRIHMTYKSPRVYDEDLVVIP
ncbi:DUF4238 domain-containing protein [Candidatus Berkiella aquae]|uniref:DUF4238 domain-containing protein n=1 Tax=Candidatus Berkiella aquae TaxID=295108 RepID=A0A0Q9YCV2_9GAMM|nr:DUF4238 domain-containing protein [Candidatus Berkiella aquae]MCS5709875.1 DUF4238 domain-containing protein [Candidatus Berkiella aquae]